MVIETFVSSGLPLTVSKLVSGDKDKNKSSAIVTTALVVGLITAFSLCIIIFVFRSLIANLFTDIRCLNILLTLLPATVFSAVYAILRGYLWGNKKFFWVSFTEFLEQIIRIIACVILVALFYSTFDKSVAVSLSLTISCIASSIIVLIVYFKHGGRFSKTKGNYKAVLKSSIPITGIRVLSSLLIPLIGIIIPLRLVAVGYTSSQALTQYGIAMGMTFPLLFLPSTVIGSLAMAIIPDLSQDYSENNVSSMTKKITTAITFSIFVSALVLPVYLGLGEAIGEFLFANKTAGYYLSYSCFIMIPIGLNNIASSILNALGLEVKGFINYLIGAIFLIIAIIILPKYTGILSLVWGMGLCMVVAGILNVAMIKKHLKIKVPYILPTLKFLGIGLPTALLGKNIYNLVNSVTSQFLSLAISGTITVVVFVVLCMVFNLIKIDAIFSKKWILFWLIQKINYVNFDYKSYRNLFDSINDFENNGQKANSRDATIWAGCYFDNRRSCLHTYDRNNSSSPSWHSSTFGTYYDTFFY